MRKTRAQLDAERLQQLEAEERSLLDGGEDDPGLPPPPGQPPLLQETPPAAPPAPKEPETRRIQLTDEQIEQLRREKADAERTNKNYEREMASMSDRQTQLEATLAELREQLQAKSDVPEDYGLTEEEREFENVVKVSEKISTAKMKKLERDLEAIKATLSSVEATASKAQLDNKVEEHRRGVQGLIGGRDPVELFTHPKIEDYILEIPLEEANALRKPLSYSKEYVASILNRFMGSIGATAPRAPAPGDVAVPRRSNPDSSTAERTPNGNVRVKFDPNTFKQDVNRLMQSGRTADANALIEEAERQMSVSS